MTHDELCERGKRWLSGTRRCNPVFSRCASCAEIPDAIGWSSDGSTVIECKTSLSDFYADKKKRFMWQHPEHENWRLNRDRITLKRAKEEGFKLIEVPMMGNFRFYMCEPGIITPAMVEEHAPDHGLVWKDGRKMTVVRVAPERKLVDRESEIRFLRFAIINGKTPHGAEQVQDESQQSLALEA